MQQVSCLVASPSFQITIRFQTKIHRYWFQILKKEGLKEVQKKQNTVEIQGV